MKEKRDRTNLNIGSRLALLRKEMGITQSEFCQSFSDFCNFEKEILVTSVSAWEQNHRLPTVTTIVLLAQFYGVSVDYLMGVTDKRNESGPSTVKEDEVRALIKHSEAPIKKADMVKYNGMPIYVRFKTNQHLSQWGILNYNLGKVICKDFIVSLSADVECYSYAVQSPVRTRVTAFQQMLDTEYLWIEMKSSDPEICALYNGRYKHNENKTALIKLDSCLVLRYEGLDTSFWAFRS